MKKLIRLKTALLFLLLSVVSANLYSQNYVFGKVVSENGFELGGVVVLNMSSEAKTLSDKDGTFMLKADAGNEIRFVKPKYERISVKVSAESFGRNG